MTGKECCVKIVVVRALYLGDLLCTVPAWRALRQLYPQAHIALVGLPWAKEFTKRFKQYIDGWIEFPGWPGIPEVEMKPEKIETFLQKMRARKWDLAIQMQGNGTHINGMIERLGAKHTAGYYVDEQPGEMWFSYPNYGHEIHRWLKLLQKLGAGTVSDVLEFPLYEDDIPPVNGNYVVIHPGAKDPKRRWPIHNYAELAEHVWRRGWQVVVTGVQAEWVLVEELQSHLSFKVINLVGKTTLGELGALLKQSRLLISNDTGVMHLAAALKVPSVVISLSDEPERWSPLDKTLHRIVRAL
jgi:ADP-heptose:LPS heptosyltransferase